MFWLRLHFSQLLRFTVPTEYNLLAKHCIKHYKVLGLSLDDTKAELPDNL